MRTILDTPDLFLKNGEFGDWQDMYENLWCHAESARYMLWTPTTSAGEAQERMRRSIEYQKKRDTAWFVYEKSSGKAIGMAAMLEIAPGIYEDGGIAVGPAFTGRGYGKQIVNALVAHAFEELGGEKFVYSCRAQNEASRRLALACGFTYTHSEDRLDPRDGKSYVLEFYERKR